MTIDELKKKIEAIDVPDSEAKLTIRVNSKDSVQARNMEEQIVLVQKNKGDIDVVTCIGNEEERTLTISSTEDGVLFLDIEGYLYTAEATKTLIDVLQVCREYMKSNSVEGGTE